MDVDAHGIAMAFARKPTSPRRVLSVESSHSIRFPMLLDCMEKA